MEYLLHILVFVGIYVILSVSLNLVAGYTGMLSIAHAAFYGVGAYAGALLMLLGHLSFLVVAIGATTAAAGVSVIVAAPALRTRDDYFVIATFALQVVTVGVMTNWVRVTGGPSGLSGVPRPSLFGWQLTNHAQFLGLVVGCSLLVLWVAHRLAHSPFGRVLKAIREDDLLAQALGKNVLRHKVTVFVIAAAMAGLAGLLYVTYVSFVDPTSFTVMESIFILSIVIIGGAGNLRGSLLGAAIMVLLPEVLRAVGLPSAVAAHVRQMVYGSVLVGIVIWRPQGLLGAYAFHSGEGRR